jgi:hypothetical protein
MTMAGYPWRERQRDGSVSTAPTPGTEDDREDAAEHYKTRRDQVAHVNVLV